MGILQIFMGRTCGIGRNDGGRNGKKGRNGKRKVKKTFVFS